ncbi:MAG: hypothetical protein JWM64_1119, partial [Frankiales bacterium]|nr:hypothetical protein [Frankiales bacterium]
EAPATATAPAGTPVPVTVPAPLGPPTVPVAAAPPAPLGPSAAPVPARAAVPVRLSALNARQVVNGNGPVERNLSVGGSRSRDGRVISVGGKRFADGLGVHTSSALTYGLDGAVRTFTATIGVDDEVGARGSVVFEVYADGALRYRSPRLTGRSAARAVTVPLLGAHTLRLVVRDGGDGAAADHADWAAARLVR